MSHDDDDDDHGEFPPTSQLLPSPSPSSPSSRWKRRRTSPCVCNVRMARFMALSMISTGALVGLFHISSRAAIATPLVASSRPSADAFKLYTISSPDASIRASFIPLGASLQSLYVKDARGHFRDVVLGYDNLTMYYDDPNHPYFGSIVGRYANRIRNSTFSIPPTFNLSIDATNTTDRKVYHTTPNENNGADTLHGGTPGWDRRSWKLLKKTQHDVTFELVDESGREGFPGRVVGKVEYRLENVAKWIIHLSAQTDIETPILLSSHVYWNLDAYKNNGSAQDHFLKLDASQYVETDGMLIPTGKIGTVRDSARDFRQAMTLGSRLNSSFEFCGSNCLGLDTDFIYDDHSITDTVLQLWSETSGIKLSISTDQPSTQIYTCSAIQHLNLPIRRKSSQQTKSDDDIYFQNSCVVIEQQSLIDAINNPQWGYNPIYSPNRPYNWNSIYTFSTL